MRLLGHGLDCSQTEEGQQAGAIQIDLKNVAMRAICILLSYSFLILGLGGPMIQPTLVFITYRL